MSLNKPWHEYIPAFLNKDKADAVFQWLCQRPEWKQEDGYCPTDSRPMVRQHDSVQWGLRQAYLSCVPQEFRIRSSGPIPQELRQLHSRIEQRYRQPFNSIQCNRHFNETSGVHAHTDQMHGDIVMLSLGCPRRFVLRYKHNDKAHTLNRWKAGDIYFDQVLEHGSVLTIYGRHQFDLTHEMPKELHSCTERISAIWRYLTEQDTKGLSQWAVIKGRPEFTEAVKRWRENNPTKQVA